MPALYHFGADGFKEDLVLDRVRQHMVPGRLCQYLKSWQLDGIRFLYKHVMGGGESCILNDESGLGKTVTVAVFLDAILRYEPGKRCLIVVRDEDYIEGWRFHLSILTNLTVKVIEKTSDINYETVFLIKWSILKDIDQTNFDYIVLDNRGDMFTNKFCTGILMRYYEHKVSIIISSTDVTADIKLLHILLRLCGRENNDFKSFEKKFQMPALKDGVITKADMEEYFLKREKVINFCREFRLRRYRHQFEEEFPLVPSSEFKQHLEDWRNHESSQSSGSVKLLSSSSEKDAEELFKTYFQVKDESKQKLDNEVQQIIERISADVDGDTESDEVVVMSPLLFVDSESDTDKETEVRQKKNVKESESNKPSLKKVEKDPSTISGRKPLRSLKKLGQTRGAMLLDKCLRSQNNSPSHAGIKIQTPIVQETSTVEQTKTPARRGRKPMVKVKKDGETGNRLKDEEAVQAANKPATTEALNARKKLTERQKPEAIEEIHNIATNRTQPTSEDQKEHQTTNAENDKGKANEDTSKQKSNDDEKATKDQNDKEDSNRTKETNNRRKQRTPRKKEDQRESTKRPARSAKGNSLEQKKRNGEKENRGRFKQNRQKCESAGKNEKRRKSKNPYLEITKTLLDAQQFLNKKYNISKPDSREHRALRRNRTADELTPCPTDDKSPTRSICSTTTSDAQKPMKNSRLEKKTNTSKATLKKSETKRPQKRNKSTKSGDDEYVPRMKTFSKGSSNQIHESSSRTLRNYRVKPLTVFSPMGLHSRSTRAMGRNTRSSQFQNKYMKIAFAQVRLSKKSKQRSNYDRPPSVVFIKGKPTPSPPPPLPPSPPVIEDSLALESMQLGQALPPNCSQTPDFTAPPTPKNVHYEFPLMLDKIIPESECLPVSETNNEVIILTDSSTTDNDQRPYIAPYFRPSMRPPMVTIPRPAYKAKSPDLFSLCGDQSLPCSQQKTNFEGFKIFGSELRKSSKMSPRLDVLDKNATLVNTKSTTLPPKETSTSSPLPHVIENEDAMFEITSNGTFGNMLRINSSGDLSPVRNKHQTTNQAAAPVKNRITNYLVGNGNTNGTSSPEDTTDILPKTPKRRKSLSGTMKRSPRTPTGGKSQTTKLTQWLVKHSVVRISDTLMKPQSTKRRRLDLSFPKD